MRNIIRLDIKQDYVVKGRQFEGYRKIAPLLDIINLINKQRNEIFLYDVVATLFGLNSIIGQLSNLLEKTFLPVTVGGGIDTFDKVDECFRLGADRIAINSANFKGTEILSYVSQKYGRQAAIAHIEAKKFDNQWCAMYQNGREIGSKELENYLMRLQHAGAGEFFVSSVDNDGMKNGFPLDLAKIINKVSRIPVILSGGIITYDEKALFDDLKSIKGLSISRAFLEKLC